MASLNAQERLLLDIPDLLVDMLIFIVSNIVLDFEILG